MSLPQASLQQAAVDRKARLQALRKRKAGEATADAGEGGEGSQFTFKPRNFDPVTRQPLKRTTAKDDEDDSGGPTTGGMTVEDRVKGVAERVIAEDERKRKEDLDLLNIAPKRANWDLKRDMDRRTRKLNRKTTEAYNVLFRQRLQALKQSSTSSNDPSSGNDLLANIAAAEEQNRRQVALDEEEGDEDEAMGELE